MQNFSAEGRRVIDDVARRHNVSSDAVATLMLALAAGQGTQAQFSHPDLGGMGQWSQGGMIMVGDMFNQGLKYRVDALCNELANLLRNDPALAAAPPSWQSQSQGQSGGYNPANNCQSQGGGYQSQSGGDFQSQGGGVSLFVRGPSNNWWPAELGAPSSSGAQNNMRYALFPVVRRLAIDINGHVTVYDTGDHQISGFSQQQSGDQSITFNSQYGVVRVADLTVVSPSNGAAEVPPPAAPAVSQATSPANDAQRFDAPPLSAPAATASAPRFSETGTASADDIFAKIERLAELRQKGILTDEEFAAKKTELLSRI